VHTPEILPSILACDLARLADEVSRLGSTVHTLHYDVMDGRYVPNISFGQPVMRSLRSAWDGDIDVHLMIVDPSRYASQFAQAGATSVAFHPEVEDDPSALVRELRAAGVRVGVGVRPEHPLDSVEHLLPEIDVLLLMTVNPGFGGQAYISSMEPKIAELRSLIDEAGLSDSVHIEVDGGIGPQTIAGAAAAGANVLIAGTALFRYEEGLSFAVSDLRRRAEQARQS
jgi:ribulose-phosphate 3-epimerase